MTGDLALLCGSYLNYTHNLFLRPKDICPSMYRQKCLKYSHSISIIANKSTTKQWHPYKTQSSLVHHLRHFTTFSPPYDWSRLKTQRGLVYCSWQLCRVEKADVNPSNSYWPAVKRTVCLQGGMGKPKKKSECFQRAENIWGGSSEPPRRTVARC